MKKSIFASAILCVLAGSAYAQSSVTVYGVVDLGLAAESGNAAGSIAKLTSGIASGSRLGFKGTEDLGNGMSANFLLESGIGADTGANNQGGLAFGRQAFVGLSGDFGSVNLGRQYTPQYLTMLMADPFSTGLAGDAANLMPNTGNASSRMDNAIKYSTKKMQGFSAELAYGFGEIAGDTAASRQLGVAVDYSGGPLNVRLGYHNRNNNTALASNVENGKNTLFALTYDFGVAKAYLAYGIDKGVNSSPLRNSSNPFASLIAPAASTDSTDLLIGTSVPCGAGTFLASYIVKDDKTAKNQDANQWALGYRYAMSKRTDLYTAYARINNKNGAGYTVGSAIEAGSGDKAFQVGVRHSF